MKQNDQRPLFVVSNHHTGSCGRPPTINGDEPNTYHGYFENTHGEQFINASLATKLINWRHSGFSVDNAVGIPVFSDKARQSLSQYIARPPLSLKKISIEENGEATVISYTSDNEFFKGKIESFSATRFLLELTQHITPRGSQVYPAVWTLCFTDQGQVAGHAPYSPPCPYRMEDRAPADF